MDPQQRLPGQSPAGIQGTGANGHLPRHLAAGCGLTIPPLPIVGRVGSWSKWGRHRPHRKLGGTFHRQYIYFARYYNGTGHHGEVLRFGPTEDVIPTLTEWGVRVLTLLMLTAGTLVYRRWPARA